MNKDNNNIFLLKKERLKSLLDCDDLADCAFIIDGEEIKAHKLILTYRSPVFEKMFYGKLASNRVVITDINLEDFTQMLEFVYTDKVRIQSVLHAWSLYYIAHKYILDDFADVCTAYIEKNLTINNLILNYEYAEMYGIEHFQNVCMRDISIYIRAVLQKKCDYHMKPSTLLAILEQSTLNINNTDLIKGVLQWAVIECDIKLINLTPENIANLLNSVKILHCLVNLDFSVESDSGDLIQNCCQIIKNLKNPNTPYKNYLKKHWCTFCYSRQTYKIAGRVEMRERDVLISNISVNRNTFLYGLVVVTEDKQFGTLSNEYNGSIIVQISELNKPESVVITNFSRSLPYETLIYVPLSDLIYLKCDKIYSIKISYVNLDNFHDLGIRKSSILCNYMSNKLIDDKRKTIFTFDELNGGVIKGICYYPA